MNRCVAAVVALLAFTVAGCTRSSEQAALHPGGQAPGVPELMRHYGCPACHVIPNVPGAVGKVGPSLESLAQRSYLAGSLPNTPGNLRNWIMHPQHYQPGTAMPEMAVTADDAAQIATFLDNNR